MKLKYIILALVVGSATTTSKAQDYDLGAFVGLSFYQGDLAPGFSNGFGNAFRGMRPAIGGIGRYNFHPNFSARANLYFGYVAAYDKFGNEGTSREIRNLSFHSPVVEASVVAEWNIMKYIAGSNRFRFTPYLFAGFGFAYVNPKTWLGDERIALRELRTEQEKTPPYWGYRAIQPVIPMGAGIKYNWDRNWSVGVEMGWRMMFTDYLDDVSGTYTGDNSGSTAALLGNRSGRIYDAGRKRGNPDNNDSYYFVGISIFKTIRPYQCR